MLGVDPPFKIELSENTPNPWEPADLPARPKTVSLHCSKNLFQYLGQIEAQTEELLQWKIAENAPLPLAELAWQARPISEYRYEIYFCPIQKIQNRILFLEEKKFEIDSVLLNETPLQNIHFKQPLFTWNHYQKIQTQIQKCLLPLILFWGFTLIAKPGVEHLNTQVREQNQQLETLQTQHQQFELDQNKAKQIKRICGLLKTSAQYSPNIRLDRLMADLSGSTLEISGQYQQEPLLNQWLKESQLELVRQDHAGLFEAQADL